MEIQQILAINIMAITALTLGGALLQGAWRDNVLWVAVNGLVVLAGAVMLQWAPGMAGTVVTVLFVPLIVAPLVLARMTQSRIHQRRMDAAARLARIGAWVHPTPAMRLNADMLAAQAPDTLGEQMAALGRLAQRTDGRERALITVTMLRLEGKWEQVLSLLEQHHELDTAMGGIAVRALGETGRLDQMTRAYDDAKAHLHGADLYTAQLFMLAFAGRPLEVRRLLDGPLAGLDTDTMRYWIAVADRASGGDPALWRPVLEQLGAHAATPSTRLAAGRMLDNAGQSVAPARLDDLSCVIIEDCAARLQSTQSAAGQGGSRTLVTWCLLAGIAAGYALSEWRGGSSSLRVLVDTGALWAPYVMQRGEWWRLVTALFLHWGPLHAGINALMLVMLGRLCERAFGSLRMALIYGVGGIASTGFVLWLTMSQRDPPVLVGASGAIMALFGAIAGRSMLNWLRYRDVLDGRNLMMLLLIVVVQVAADIATPQVSLAAHASGFITGLIVAVLIGLMPRRAA